MKNTPMKTAVIMPPMTPTPTTCRAAAPAPVATARGRQPMIKAMLVIRMGRRRILAASRVAVSRSVP